MMNTLDPARFNDPVHELTRLRSQLWQLPIDSQKDLLCEIYSERIAELEHDVARREANPDASPLAIPPLAGADMTVGREVLKRFKQPLRELGQRLMQSKIRVVALAPGFVDLSASSTEVRERSAKYLETEAMILDLMDQPRSAWAAIVCRPGHSAHMGTLLSMVKTLPECIRTRLVLVSDGSPYSHSELFAASLKTRVPIVAGAAHDTTSTWPRPEMRLLLDEMQQSKSSMAFESDVLTSASRG